MVFLRKKFLHGKWVILGPKMTCCHNSGSALTVFFKFCTIVSLKKLSLAQLPVFQIFSLMHNVQILPHAVVSHNIVSNSCPIGSSIKYICWKGGGAKSILARMGGGGRFNCKRTYTPQPRFFCRFVTKVK